MKTPRWMSLWVFNVHFKQGSDIQIFIVMYGM